MNSADLTYLISFAISFLVAGFVSGIRLFAINRRCRRVELRLVDLEGAHLSVRGKVAARTRWDQDEWVKNLEKETVPGRGKPRRYDNDPLGEE